MDAARVIVAAAWLAACYQPAVNYESCTVQCSADQSCPPGYACEDGVCRASGEPPCERGVVDAASDPPIDAPGPVVPNACPSSYVAISVGAGSGRYLYVPTTKMWADAAATCASHLPPGGTFRTHLAVINSEVEAAAVAGYSLNLAGWIGLSDRKTNTSFIWVTTEDPQPVGDTSPLWGPMQPDPAGDCVIMQATDLRTATCNTVTGYYCECDLFADDPTRY